MVTGLETAGDAIAQAVTNKGVFKGDAFVLALGAESPILARKLGIQLPIYPIKGYSLTIPIGNRLSPPTIASVDEHNLVAISRFGDRIRVTATAEFAGYDTSHKPSDFAFMKEVTQELYPEGADYDPKADDPQQSAVFRTATLPQPLPQHRTRTHRLDHVPRLGQNHRRPDRWARPGHFDGRSPDRVNQRAKSMSLTEVAAPSAHSGPLDLGVLPSELDGGVASRAAIGLVVLATDQTMEHEFRALVRKPGVAIYKTRVFNDYEITPETLRAIGPRIAPSVALILPNIPLHVVAFGCTSATMTLGEDAVFAEIHKARPNVACTTPVTAALAAFRALRARSIGLLTPYAPEINESLARYFINRGLKIAAVATFDRRDDRGWQLWGRGIWGRRWRWRCGTRDIRLRLLWRGRARLR